MPVGGFDAGDAVEQGIARRQRRFVGGGVGETAAQIAEVAFGGRRAGDLAGGRVEMGK